MNTKLALSFFVTLFSVNTALAFSTYYPETVLSVIENESSTSSEIKDSLFVLLTKVHVRHENSSDTLSDVCPTNSDCLSQKADLTYSEARKIMFGDLFLERHSNEHYSLKEVYCNKVIDETGGVGPNKIPNPEIINCEHTWPQSKFSKEFPSEIQKSDLHHLFPSDMHANSTRNNHPFAEVRGKFTSETCQDSKIGAPLEGGVTSFEPPKEHRGNVARAMAYFSVRYKLPIDTIQKKYFEKWNLEDPVDNEERVRNEKILRIQGNRNPFVDYPELIKKL